MALTRMLRSTNGEKHRDTIEPPTHVPPAVVPISPSQAPTNTSSPPSLSPPPSLSSPSSPSPTTSSKQQHRRSTSLASKLVTSSSSASNGNCSDNASTIDSSAQDSDTAFFVDTSIIPELHPDDARDKVFVAILKALASMNNKPSSPKELSSCIMKNKFAMLGGNTPFATVSSRISQHFKRVHEHNPPRPPVLGKVADENNARKIHYYIASVEERQEYLDRAWARRTAFSVNSGKDIKSANPMSITTRRVSGVVFDASADHSNRSAATTTRRRSRHASSGTIVVTKPNLSSSHVVMVTHRQKCTSEISVYHSATDFSDSDGIDHGGGSCHERRASSQSVAPPYGRGKWVPSPSASPPSSADSATGASADKDPMLSSPSIIKDLTNSPDHTPLPPHPSPTLSAHENGLLDSAAMPSEYMVTLGPSYSEFHEEMLQASLLAPANPPEPELDLFPLTAVVTTTDTSPCSTELVDTPIQGSEEEQQQQQQQLRSDALTPPPLPSSTSVLVEVSSACQSAGFPSPSMSVNSLSGDCSNEAGNEPSATSSASGACCSGVSGAGDYANSLETASDNGDDDEELLDRDLEECEPMSLNELDYLWNTSVVNTTKNTAPNSPPPEASAGGSSQGEPIGARVDNRCGLGDSGNSDGSSGSSSNYLSKLTAKLLSLSSNQKHAEATTATINSNSTTSCLSLSETATAATVTSGNSKTEIRLLPDSCGTTTTITATATTTTTVCATACDEGNGCTGVASPTRPVKAQVTATNNGCSGSKLIRPATLSSLSLSPSSSGVQGTSNGASSESPAGSTRSRPAPSQLLAITNKQPAEIGQPITGANSGRACCHASTSGSATRGGCIDRNNRPPHLNPSSSSTSYSAAATNLVDKAVGATCGARETAPPHFADPSTMTSRLPSSVVKSSTSSSSIASARTAGALRNNVNNNGDSGVPLGKKMLGQQPHSRPQRQQQQQQQQSQKPPDARSAPSQSQEKKSDSGRKVTTVPVTRPSASAPGRVAASGNNNSSRRDDDSGIRGDLATPQLSTAIAPLQSPQNNPAKLFPDLEPSAIVQTKVKVSPCIILTILETVPVYMTVISVNEPSPTDPNKQVVRHHRLLRLVETGYVNASSLLAAGGICTEGERNIILSLEVGRFKWRRPKSQLNGTWIPLPRARALAATCSLNHRLGPFLNDNLESYYPSPLPTEFIQHLIMPFFTTPPGMSSRTRPLSGTSSQPATPVSLSRDGSKNTTTSSAGGGQVAVKTSISSENPNGINGTGNTNGQKTASPKRQVADGENCTANLATIPKGKASSRPTLLRRSQTFGSSARSVPSPSIIQSLGRKDHGTLSPGITSNGGSSHMNLDDHYIRLLLQLLNRDAPMLSAGSTLIGFEDDIPMTPTTAAGTPSDINTGLLSLDSLPADLQPIFADLVERSTTPQKHTEPSALLADPGNIIGASSAITNNGTFFSASPAGRATKGAPAAPNNGSASKPTIGLPRKGADKVAQDAVNGQPQKSAAISKSLVGSRIMQAMDSLGISGVAKSNLLIRLKAAMTSANAANLQRQQVVSPLMLEHNFSQLPTTAATSGVHKRSRPREFEDSLNTASSLPGGRDSRAKRTRMTQSAQSTPLLTATRVSSRNPPPSIPTLTSSGRCSGHNNHKGSNFSPLRPVSEQAPDGQDADDEDDMEIDIVGINDKVTISSGLKKSRSQPAMVARRQQSTTMTTVSGRKPVVPGKAVAAGAQSTPVKGVHRESMAKPNATMKPNGRAQTPRSNTSGSSSNSGADAKPAIKSAATACAKQQPQEKTSVGEEDELVDIGGSDGDDDLR